MKIKVLTLSILFTVGMAYAEPMEIASAPQVSAAQTQAAAQNQTNGQVSVTPSPLTPQPISFENCSKIFNLDKEKLFYLTFGAISANNFVIEEIQSNNGYIIFKAANNKYLATIAGVDNANSILKITPCNDIYVFPSGIINNTFKYIELNKNIELK